MIPIVTYEFISPTNTRFSAICPDHGRKTSDWQGTQVQGMLFRCQGTKGWGGADSHIFPAKPPVGLPKKLDEVQAWVNKQLQAKIKEPGEPRKK